VRIFCWLVDAHARGLELAHLASCPQDDVLRTGTVERILCLINRELEHVGEADDSAAARKIDAPLFSHALLVRRRRSSIAEKALCRLEPAPLVVALELLEQYCTCLLA
jgi:hypothetical protein